MMEIENGDSETQSADQIGAADLLNGCFDGGNQSSAGQVAGVAGESADARQHRTAHRRGENRAAFLAPLIGEPWAWQSRNCWDFACHVQRELFGRALPRVAVPADPSKRWVLESIDRHPERAAWREVPDGPGGLVAAADGALVLMAHLRFPAHIGVWLKPEARVIHCSEQHGVCCETVLALRQTGWKQLTFYEPIS
jgi:hypothetical protein